MDYYTRPVKRPPHTLDCESLSGPRDRRSRQGPLVPDTARRPHVWGWGGECVGVGRGRPVSVVSGQGYEVGPGISGDSSGPTVAPFDSVSLQYGDSTPRGSKFYSWGSPDLLHPRSRPF